MRPRESIVSTNAAKRRGDGANELDCTASTQPMDCCRTGTTRRPGTRRPLRSGTASRWSTLGDSLFPWEYPGSTLGVPFGVLIRCSTGPLSVPDFPLPSTGCLYSLPSSVRISSKRPHERRSALDRTRKCCIVGCLHRRESSPARPDYAPFKHKVPMLLAAAATPDDGCRSHGRRTGSRGRRCG